MCGLYARFGLLNGREIDNLKKIQHRGPDNISSEIGTDYFLGHTRLSLFDLTENSNQPFKYFESMMVFNGEIYNYLEIKEKYYKNEPFDAPSDTFVLSRLLYDFGSDVLSELDGMFSVVFFDARIEEVIVARDLAGIKPLYLHKTDSYLDFSSEIKCFESIEISNEINKVFTERSFQLGDLPYKGVLEVPAGSFCKFKIKDKNLEFEKFKSPLNMISKGNFTQKDLIDKLDNLVNSTIELHMRSDAKIGSLCSGGLDSSLISAIAYKLNPNLKLYHAGVKGKGGEEYYSNLVSKYINCEIEYQYMDKFKFWADFAYVTYISDIPIYHPNDLSLHMIAKKVHQDGCKALLSGEGADEMFGGYSWHQSMIKTPFLGMYSGNNRYIRFVIRKIKQYLTPLAWARDKKEFFNVNPLGIGYGSENLSHLVKGYSFQVNNFKKVNVFNNIIDAYLKSGYTQEEAYNLAIIHQDFYGHLGSILHRTDRILMANSIEGRVPFIENNLIEFSMQIGLNQKISGTQGKYLLKKVAERYLPKEVIYRRKAGFPVPWQNYLNGVEHILKDGFIESLTNLDFSRIINYVDKDKTFMFLLISLEVWGRIFAFKQSYLEVSELIMSRVE